MRTNFRTPLLLASICAAFAVAPAMAQNTVNVHIDTSAAQGTRGRIAFTFLGGSPATNTLQILNFSTDATLDLPVTEGGLVTGDLILRVNPAAFTQIEDDFFYNELALPTTTMSFGNQIDFSLQLSENAVLGAIPDELSFFLLDEDGQRLFATSDPLGSDALLALCATGTSGGELSVFAPATVQDRNVSIVVAPTFQDVPFTSGTHKFVERLVEAGVTAGCNTVPRLYCPQDAVTRDQMAVFIVTSLGFAPDSSGPQIFDDVPPTSPYYGFVQVFSRLGITAGCSTNPPLYCPGAPVTRAQMAVFILAALGISPDNSGPQIFEDVPPTSPYYGFVQAFSRLGITAGCSQNPPLFCPNGSVLREQMAVFLVVAFFQRVAPP